MEGQALEGRSALMTDYERLVVTKSDGVGWLILDRPDAGKRRRAIKQEKHDRNSVGGRHPIALQSGGDASRSSVAGHARAEVPNRSTIRSWICWLSVAWWTFPIDDAAPGDWPADSAARTRAFVQPRTCSCAQT